MKFSVLDQSPIRSGVCADVSIRESVALAQHCEALGYARYWVSEHHSSGAVAGSAPEILMAAIAATTKTIRVGSAGVMLPHYSALKVAEQFRVLEAIAPGRIDLGVGRAPGSDGRTALALNPNAAAAADNFPSAVRDLMAWSSGSPLPEAHPFRMVHAEPRGPFAPEIWILGSSNYGAQVAAFFGLPYCFAYFFSDGVGAREALDIYHSSYRPSEKWPQPHAALTVWAFAGATQEEADYYYQSRAIARLMRDKGQYIPLPSPAEAASWDVSDIERAHMARVKERAFSGTAADVAARLRDLAAQTGIAELAITTTAYEPTARQNSYTLLAREFGLHETRLVAA
ncbi:MAG: luciferase family oxidoreductase [Acidocella sp. 20-57-95]|nr:MAG: luciferase family oxidoreductase [Acidocella sp. 20-57-95]OYV61880.1 MAG: luciferase family oxidoreductase [Acidocella sp. 21-58-7]HQT65254.1 LLM class flavin-dependent oxidoreductase [Acidocella sp.]HQU03623.1 LLM class flavin-dependent oxidoreductase [Acidocella sp.]